MAESGATLTADVLVVGAGPAGSAAAARLAAAGWDVLLVDRAEFPRDKTCGDGLTPRAVRTLQTLGAFERVAARAHRLDAARIVSPGGHQLRIRFADHLDGWPHFALVLPRYELDDCLRQHAIASGARFLGDCKVIAPLPARSGAVAQRGGESLAIESRLVVLATGASLPLLRSFGFLRQLPPTVSAARAYWEGVEGPDDTMEFFFDRRFARGYLWLFPLGEGRANIGLGLFPYNGQPRPSAARLLTEALADYAPLASRLRRARRLSPIKGYPLRTDFPHHPVVADGVLLAGEACGLVNPVTGEGIDLALESGLLAAAAADAALQRGDMAAATLSPYARELRSRFAAFFREMRWLVRWAMGPRALDILVRQGARHPDLARTITLVNLGLLPPRAAVSLRTWRDILF